MQVSLVAHKTKSPYCFKNWAISNIKCEKKNYNSKTEHKITSLTNQINYDF